MAAEPLPQLTPACAAWPSLTTYGPRISRSSPTQTSWGQPVTTLSSGIRLISPPKDKAESETYRAAYPACTGIERSPLPFIVRFFGLATYGSAGGSGYVGLLSSNSFMKREFGRSLIEQFFPTVDLTHVIDTSGVFIPGHGTPTVLLLGRNQRPASTAVRVIVGLRGEPEVPRNPADGHVWQLILRRIAQVPPEDDWDATAADSPLGLSLFPVESRR